MEIFLYKDEIKILKYIKRQTRKHVPISEAALMQKFNNFNKKYMNLSSLIVRNDTGEEEFIKRESKFYASQKNVNVNETLTFNELYVADPKKVFYTLSRQGYQYLYDKQHNTWLFWFPYTITTLIAIASIISQFIK